MNPFPIRKISIHFEAADNQRFQLQHYIEGDEVVHKVYKDTGKGWELVEIPSHVREVMTKSFQPTMHHLSQTQAMINEMMFAIISDQNEKRYGHGKDQ